MIAITQFSPFLRVMKRENFENKKKNDRVLNVKLQVHNFLRFLPVLDPNHHHHLHLPQDSSVSQGKESLMSIER